MFPKTTALPILFVFNFLVLKKKKNIFGTGRRTVNTDLLQSLLVIFLNLVTKVERFFTMQQDCSLLFNFMSIPLLNFSSNLSVTLCNGHYKNIQTIISM